MEDKDLDILQGQYSGYWYPGNTRSQGISGYCIGLIRQFCHDDLGV